MSDELLPVMISALQHYSYCPRQCALIHQEQTFSENVFTLRGQRVHKRVDQPETRIEDGITVERALPLQHKGIGLVGKADVVEIGGDGTPCPVEYKHGPKRKKL
ncbi:MAG: Dna2/Cas4 domain-containing protein, partial [Immundisolibacteraceae bacterium]|nr:Dna2/Cas4 domain-containing protein [Immundisolibacteraceae bacterium]